MGEGHRVRAGLAAPAAPPAVVSSGTAASTSRARTRIGRVTGDRPAYPSRDRERVELCGPRRPRRRRPDTFNVDHARVADAVSGQGRARRAPLRPPGRVGGCRRPSPRSSWRMPWRSVRGTAIRRVAHLADGLPLVPPHKIVTTGGGSGDGDSPSWRRDQPAPPHGIAPAGRHPARAQLSAARPPLRVGSPAGGSRSCTLPTSASPGGTGGSSTSSDRRPPGTPRLAGLRVNSTAATALHAPGRRESRCRSGRPPRASASLSEPIVTAARSPGAVRPRSRGRTRSRPRRR
jgi:hypothetical protein